MSEELIAVILRERSWSWSIIGLLSIFVSLILRAFLLSGILRSMRIRNKSWYQRTLSHYQKRSALGWVFFGLFNLGIILLWSMESKFLKYFSSLEWFLIFVCLFSLSVFFHLRAYARSIVEAVEDHVAMDKEL